MVEWEYPSEKDKMSAVAQMDPAVTNDTTEGWVWHSLKMDKKDHADIPSDKPGKTVSLLTDDWYDCAFCGGAGEKPRGSVCSVCKGKKRIQLNPPVVKCASCKGRGEEKRGGNITCTPCRGKGYVSVVEPAEVCPTCNGVGKTRGSNLACVQCKGIGAITRKEMG
jgi:DnaJ-class molecular chaperone